MRLDRAKWAAAILAASLPLIWPSIWNGFPLMFSSDSIGYLGSGIRVARALLLGEFSTFYGDRSLIYGLSILPFHGNASAWPVVGAHAIVTAFVLSLVMRALLPDHSPATFLLVVTALCLSTGLGWFVSCIMPDVLGPILYLALYLIAFCREALSRTERMILVILALWGAMSHPTHLVVAAGLSAIAPVLLAWQNRSLGPSLRAAGWLGGILLAAAIMQVSLHSYLLGKPALFNDHYPFLLARVVTDAPGQEYLEQRCDSLDLEICQHVAELPDAPARFIWGEGGIWQSSSPAAQRRLLDQEMSVVFGVLRADSWRVMQVSAGHFLHQGMTFGLEEFAATSQWLLQRIDTVLRNSQIAYLQSRQVHRTLHVGFFTRVQRWTVVLSTIVIALWVLRSRHCESPRLVAFASVIVFVIIANAAVTGPLSAVAGRYQGRVIWLLPLLAVMLLLSRSNGIRSQDDVAEVRSTHSPPGKGP